MLLYSSCYKNNKVTRGAAWWRRTAHVLFHLPLCIRIGHTLTKSRSLSPPPPPLCPWQMPPSPFVSAAMLNERSEKNTSEREREREKKGKTCDIYLFTDAHVFLHAARRCGGPKQFATTFYFECTYGEWRELARLVPGGQN